MLELRAVTKQYRSQSSSLPVLEGVNLELEAGDSVAVVGPSGSGKSTLLNIIGTLDQPDSGEVILNGENLRQHDAVRLAEIRNRQIGFIFQSHHLLPQCSVLENVLIPALATRQGRQSPGLEDRALRLLGRVGLGDRLQHRPSQLSGGERQRTAVVRALINSPRIILADEPTGALDRASAQNLADLIVDLNREEQVTLIVVTHALDLARRMKRVFELKDGRLQTFPAA